MAPAGQKSINEAKLSGAWDEMNDVDDLVIPRDLHDSLSHESDALQNFLTFPRPSTRRNILRWIALAKKSETRQRRIDRITIDAAKNVRTPVDG